MSGGQIIFFVPIVVFLVIVAPIWIIVHYKSKNRAAGDLSDAERMEVDEMSQVANERAARVETLESIVDVESPGWRDKQN